MANGDAERGQLAFKRMVEGLYARSATGRTALSFELGDEFLASMLESGSEEVEEADISDVKLQFFQDAALFSCRVQVKGQAWPPRPPVDTTIEFGAKEITHSDDGEAGSITFRVEKPLTFSSKFADIIIGLLGKLTKKLPVSIDALRQKDALVKLDLAQLVGMTRPDVSPQVKQVRIYGLQAMQGRIRVEIGFVK